MSKICPETNKTVLYLDCLECETKSCRKQKNTEKEQGKGKTGREG